MYAEKGRQHFIRRLLHCPLMQQEQQVENNAFVWLCMTPLWFIAGVRAGWWGSCSLSWNREKAGKRIILNQDYCQSYAVIKKNNNPHFTIPKLMSHITPQCCSTDTDRSEGPD